MYETVYRQVMYSLIATFAVPFFTQKTMGRVFIRRGKVFKELLLFRTMFGFVLK